MLKLTITLWMLIAFIGGGILNDAITPHVTHTITKQVPVYLPVHKGKHFDQQRDLLAAAIPVSLLTKKGHH